MILHDNRTNTHKHHNHTHKTRKPCDPGITSPRITTPQAENTCTRPPKHREHTCNMTTRPGNVRPNPEYISNNYDITGIGMVYVGEFAQKEGKRMASQEEHDRNERGMREGKPRIDLKWTRGNIYADWMGCCDVCQRTELVGRSTSNRYTGTRGAYSLGWDFRTTTRRKSAAWVCPKCTQDVGVPAYTLEFDEAELVQVMLDAIARGRDARDGVAAVAKYILRKSDIKDARGLNAVIKNSRNTLDNLI